MGRNTSEFAVIFSVFNGNSGVDNGTFPIVFIYDITANGLKKFRWAYMGALLSRDSKVSECDL